MSKNRFQIVAVATEKASQIVKNDLTDNFIYRASPSINDVYGTNQHLYLLDTQAPIEEQNVWYKRTGKINIGVCSNTAFNNPEWLNSEDCKNVSKVIASTDTSLGLPKIAGSLIEDYVTDQNLIVHSVSFANNMALTGWETTEQQIFNKANEEASKELWLLCGQTKFDKESYGDKINIITTGNKETIDKKLEELVATNEWVGLFTMSVEELDHLLFFVEELGIKSKSIQEQDSHYQYRNLDITASEEEWCVCGTDKGVNGLGRSSGVLEWCYGKEDATRMLSKMSQYARFSNLSIDCLKPKQKIQPELIAILRNCFKMKINSITFPAGSFDVEYELPCDDKDYVTFHRSSNPSEITDTLLVNKIRTTEQPIWKDWYMTINYHA
jgi:hypothetical protein